jgi:hypothetical protein
MESSDVQDVKLNDTELSANSKETSTKDESKVVPLAELIAERKKRQEYEKKIREIEESEIAKKGEYETLANKYKVELESLQKDMTEKEMFVEKWKTYESKQREQYKSVLGDMPDIDKMSLEQLEYLAKKVNKVPDVDINPAKPKTVITELSQHDNKRALEMFIGWSEKDAYEAYSEILNKKKK